MVFRSARERVVQVILFELCALLLTLPLYAFLLGQTASEAFYVVVCMTSLEVVFGYAHDWLFDRFEWRLAERPADCRPLILRLCHAVSREVSLLVLSVPAIMFLAGAGLWEALVADIVITLTFIVYTFVFFRIYDFFVPVREDRYARRLSDLRAPGQAVRLTEGAGRGTRVGPRSR